MKWTYLCKWILAILVVVGLSYLYLQAKNTFRGFCTLYESAVKMFLSIFANINGGGTLI